MTPGQWPTKQRSSSDHSTSFTYREPSVIQEFLAIPRESSSPRARSPQSLRPFHESRRQGLGRRGTALVLTDRREARRIPPSNRSQSRSTAFRERSRFAHGLLIQRSF